MENTEPVKYFELTFIYPVFNWVNSTITVSKAVKTAWEETTFSSLLEFLNQAQLLVFVNRERVLLEMIQSLNETCKARIRYLRKIIRNRMNGAVELHVADENGDKCLSASLKINYNMKEIESEMDTIENFKAFEEQCEQFNYTKVKALYRPDKQDRIKEIPYKDKIISKLN